MSGLGAKSVAEGGAMANCPQNSLFEIYESSVCSDKSTTFVLYEGSAGS